MKEIFIFLKKFHFTILFILLEIFSIILIVNFNNFQAHIFDMGKLTVSNYFYSHNEHIISYFKLKDENEKLVKENTMLRNLMMYSNYQYHYSLDENLDRDSVYHFIPARNILTTYNRTRNIIILNKGTKCGVMPEMAVCSQEGVVGIIKDVNKKFASVLPLINVDCSISAKIKRNEYYGSLKWDGDDYRYSYLYDIPYHVEVFRGDTIVTSGFSLIFPPDFLIGVVDTVQKTSENFLDIRVKLAVNFRNIKNVYIVNTPQKEDFRKIEFEYDKY